MKVKKLLIELLKNFEGFLPPIMMRFSSPCRYKIKAEIARKQKDQESDRSSPMISTPTTSASLDKIMTNAAAGYIDNSLNRGGTYDSDTTLPSLQKLQVYLIEYIDLMTVRVVS